MIMKRIICVAAMFAVFGASSAFASDYYVATNGNDSTGTGSIGSPYATLAHAVSVVSAGDTIYVRGGTYATSAKISISKMGTSSSPYTVTNYSGETPIMDFSGEADGTDAISLTGAYWKFYGLVITNAGHNAIKVVGSSTAGAGSHNTFVLCTFRGCRDTGFNIGSSTATTYLPGTNIVLNCDSYRNYDKTTDGGNADGFAVKYTVGTGNEFHGCRSWENSDDGWDLWMATQPVLIDTCWTWRNGSNSWNDTAWGGNGNGFKLGGNNIPAAHVLVRSISYSNVGTNGGYGIDQNNNTAGLTVDQNITWANRSGAINLNHSPSQNEHHIVRNNVVIWGTVSTNSVSTQLSNSWQVISSAVTSNDFLSMDTSFLSAPRQADGSLPINPLVRPVPNGRLVDMGCTNVGAPFYGFAPDLGPYETASLTWRGDGVSNVWDSGVTSNWFDGKRLMAFTNTAFVTFDDTGSNNPAINLVGTLSPYRVTVTSTQNYTFGGTGSLDGWMMSLVKAGTGQLNLTTSNTFGGGTTISNGTLLVNNTSGSGTGTGAVTVVSGATLGGSGTIGGPVTVNGTLTPGPAGGVGTLTISNTLVVNSGAVLQYALGTNSDLTAVSSNLTLGGTLNVADGGGFTATTYRLFNYGGTLTYSGLTVGTKPNTNFIYTVSTSTVGQVNLIVSNSTASLVASFTGSPTNGVVPLSVTFTDTSTGSITSNFWDFGDGSTTNFTVPTNVTHTYSVVGVYSVTLIASGSADVSTNTQVNLITVLDPFTVWQLEYFGCTACPQAAADADPLGKGMSNTNQFLAGINPTNNLSALRIVSVVPQSNDVVITWTTAGGRTNAVQATSGDGNSGYSTNFVDINKAPIILPGSGDATTNCVDVGGATNAPSRYYRVRLVP